MYKFNTAELEAEIALKGIKKKTLSEVTGIKKTALYRKIKGKSEFTQSEISKVIDAVGIEYKKAMHIFFNKKVS